MTRKNVLTVLLVLASVAISYYGVMYIASHIAIAWVGLLMLGFLGMAVTSAAAQLYCLIHDNSTCDCKHTDDSTGDDNDK